MTPSTRSARHNYTIHAGAPAAGGGGPLAPPWWMSEGPVGAHALETRGEGTGQDRRTRDEKAWVRESEGVAREISLKLAAGAARYLVQ